MKQALVILLSAFILLALPACARKDDAPAEAEPAPAAGDAVPEEIADDAPRSPVDGMTVAFISGGPDEPFASLAREGALDYAGEWGMELLCPVTADQSVAVQQAIDAGVCGICIAPDGTDALAAKLREARAAGIPVVFWYSAAPDERALTVSQGTAQTLGPMLVEMGAESLRERGVDADGEVRYVWHTSDPEAPAQRDRYAAAREYIKAHYPNWSMAADPVCSGADTARAVAAGGSILDELPDASLILCDDPAALLGQCLAAENRGVTAGDVSITGFCPYDAIRPYLDSGVCARWGLWDCGMQAAMGCYLAAQLSAGNELSADSVVFIPRIGCAAVLPAGEQAAVNSGVVPVPEHVVLTAQSAADYDF